MDRMAEVAHLKREASSAKTRLFDIEKRLRSIGANREAESLSRVIGRLEGWQNR